MVVELMSNLANLAAQAPSGVTVLVADDHALVRSGLKLIVAGILDDVRFIEAVDGNSLMAAVQWYPGIRLGLVDLSMPAMQGGLRLTELSRCRPEMPLIVVSALNSPDVVRRVMNVPTVCAFVPKSADVSAMRCAVEAAMSGRRMAAPPPVSRQLPELTPRQEEVHGLLSQGMSNKVIATLLGISEGTVKNHVSEIFRVLNTTNRTQAAQRLPESP